MSCNLASFLRAHAASDPDRVALRFALPHAGPGRPKGQELTFAELDRHSDAYARGFRHIGLRRGDRTLVLVRPSLDFYAAMFGLFKLGAVPVLMDPGMGLRNLLACIGRTRPRAVVALPAVHAIRTFVPAPFASADLHVTVGARLFWGGHTLAGLHERGIAEEGPFPLADFAADEEAAILFTSGSTGTPKGVRMDHGAFSALVATIGEAFAMGPGDVTMEAFAAFVFFDVALGVTTVVPDMDLSRPARADPRKIVDAVVGNDCTVAFASPVVWNAVLRWCRAEGRTLPSLTRVLTAGAPIQAEVHRRFRDVLRPGAQLFTPYGATEAMTVALVGSDAFLAEGAAAAARGEGTLVGPPLRGTDVRIVPITDAPVREWDEALRQPPGVLGEVVVGGAVVSREYKDDPAANDVSKIRDGDRILHRTGDLGYLDAQGRLWFCGRKAHRLETPSGTVPAVPVEGIFNEHPQVFRTALVGLGPRGSEEPLLLVELEPGAVWSPALEAEILALARGTRFEGLVGAARPHPGFPVDARHNSKIRREDLKAWAEARLPRREVA